MADQKGPSTSSSAQPVVSFTPRKAYSQLPIPVPMSVEGNLKENCCWFFFVLFFLKEDRKSYKIATELDKKSKGSL